MIQFDLMLYILLGAFSLVSLVICLMFEDHAINIANAITGSYLIMRGIGLILNYPYEFTIYD